MDAWAPSQILINTLQTRQKMALASRGVVISHILLAFGLSVQAILLPPQKSEAAPKLEIIMWLLEFDWEPGVKQHKRTISLP